MIISLRHSLNFLIFSNINELGGLEVMVPVESIHDHTPDRL